MQEFNLNQIQPRSNISSFMHKMDGVYIKSISFHKLSKINSDEKLAELFRT